MKAIELFEVEQRDIGRYDPEKDELSRFNLDQTRRPKITLRHLNRLKKIRATKKLEQLQKESLLQVMYGASTEEEEGGL